jgi:aldose 1-epimerase
VDHCFDGWSGSLQLTDAVLRTRVTSTLSRLVVFTTPQRDSIAIEPVSHINNAVNLMARTGASADELGVCILQPGQTFSCEMRIEVERTQ